MSRYGNLAAGPDNRVTPEDMACWRDLIAGAKRLAGGDANALVTRFRPVARAAGNACAPGVVTRNNPFVRLSRLSKRYVGETAAGRHALQGELMAAALKAEETLAAEGEGRATRERKDIDG